MKNFLSKNQKYTILYFYPKNNTPGCTLEALDFNRLKQDFLDLGIEIFGISRDNENSHNNFCQKNNLSISLISDENEELHNFFGVIGEKNNYGKISIGVIRSTFLLESDTGKILKEWRNVKVKGHAEKILEEIKSMKI